jgi:hypothetical protein
MLCDCGNPAFSEKKICEQDTFTGQQNIVAYTLITSKRPAIRFTGKLCSEYVQKLTLTSFFFGGFDSDRTVESRPINGIDCLRRTQTLDCHGEKMVKTMTGWEFKRKPTGSPSWWSTSVISTQNCLIEDIELTQTTENAPISSPFGDIRVDPALQTHFVIGSQVLIWDNPTEPVACKEFTLGGRNRKTAEGDRHLAPSRRGKAIGFCIKSQRHNNLS